MAMKSPSGFVNAYNGKLIDYDHAYGVQCVDGFKTGCDYIGVPVQPCPNNWAESYWTCQNPDGSINADIQKWQTEYFDLIDDPDRFRDGDWIVWPRGCASHPSSHIAMYYQGQEFGERQYEDNRAFCLKYTNFSDASGALRWIGWEKMELKEGYQEIKISGVTVTAYKSSHRLGLINAGGLKPLAQIDMQGILIYERSGNNLFDSAGTVYGPRVCLNGQVDEPEDSKNYLYYAILKDGSLSFGDWDGQYKDPAGYQSMFSPKAIYAVGKTPKYAPQYGLKALTESVWQSYIAHMSDGSFVKGVSKRPITAKALWSGLQAYGADSLAIMDGGSGGIGSAQQRYWDGSKAVDAQTSGRAVGDIIVFYETASGAEKPADSSDNDPSDYQSMYQEKCAELDALQAKYEALQKTNAENLQTANDLKKKYEEAIEKALDILKGVVG